MSTGSSYLTVRGVSVDVVYKDIKNLHIGVYPPLGRVRVAAPLRLDDERVRLAVVQRWPWISRQRRILQAAERQNEREMVTGESHYVWGVRKRLTVIETEGRPNARDTKQRLIISVPPGYDTHQRRALLERWYRRELRSKIAELMEQWEPVVGRHATSWSVRRMKTKWGSCNPDTGNLRFNLELAAKHPDCAEYVVVHELAHLVVRGHGESFTTLMDQLLPDWQARRDLLNGAPLASQEWQ